MDPCDDFTVPMSRPRLYLILWRKDTCKWTGPSVEDWMEAMAPVKIMPEKRGAKFNAEIFAALPDPLSTRTMTPGELKHLKQYKELLANERIRKDITVVDLRQSKERPVTSLVNGCLPTLRTTCGSLYLLNKKQFLSGRQLLRAQGWPIHEVDSERLGLSHVVFPPSVCKTGLISMAGNAMFGAFPALAVFTALLFIEKKA